jgi:PAS domain S-box-containing protein
VTDNLDEMERIAQQEIDDAKLRVTISAAVIEALPDAIMVADQNGKIFLVNHETEIMFGGYTRKELLGTSIETLLPERLREVHVKHRANYMEEPRTRYMGASMQLSGRRKDGSEFPIEISLSPVPTERGLFVITTIRRKRG